MGAKHQVKSQQRKTPARTVEANYRAVDWLLLQGCWPNGGGGCCEALVAI
jgi:hypothetical protein